MNNFRFRVFLLLQIIILGGIFGAIFSFLILDKYPFLIAFLLVLSIFLVIQYIVYIEKIPRTIKNLFHAANNHDFSHVVSDSYMGGYFEKEWNALIENIRHSRVKDRSENTFLRALIRQAPVSIMAFDDIGRLSLYNPSAEKLLGLASPNTILDFDELYPHFGNRLKNLDSGSRSIFKANKNGVEQSWMISSAKAILEGKAQTLITIENIGRELIEAEYTAWRNLIGVLTHEVMNSITPIVSLANTGKEILQQDNLLVLPKDVLQDEIDDLSEVVSIIAHRGEGMMSFVQGYRKLSLVSHPNCSLFSVKKLLDEQVLLHQSLCKVNNIQVKSFCQPSSLKIHADQQQLEQVLINIMKNAIDALRGQQVKNITLHADQRQSEVVIAIEDTGCGIANDVLNQIFVPFFTTKKQGTGIGMALTRQIMHAHGGQIRVQSQSGSGTRVELIF